MRATERKGGSGMGSEAKLQQERKREERSERDGTAGVKGHYH